jgi:hypothetical protein
MNLLRRASTGRLITGIVVLVVVSVATAFAMQGRTGPKPPQRSLAAAIQHALKAKPVQGVTARISFTDHLFPSDSLGQAGSSPLISGASGRLWAGDGRVRLELQSATGDTEVGIGPSGVVVYDVSTADAYEFPFSGRSQPADSSHPRHAVPGIADIQRAIARLAQRATLSGAVSTNVGGQPAYRVSISPRHSGGLLGAVELAWDANHGVPLEIAVTSQGSSSPVLALRVTQISYGPVPASDLAVGLGSAEHVIRVQPPAGTSDSGHGSGADTRLPFAVRAPQSLVGIPKLTVRRVDWAGHPAALAVYGHGLGTVLVLEQAATAGGRAGPLASLPRVSVGAAVGHELDTALGTILQVDHGGVSYTVIGSLPAAAAQSAARALVR